VVINIVKGHKEMKYECECLVIMVVGLGHNQASRCPYILVCVHLSRFVICGLQCECLEYTLMTKGIVPKRDIMIKN
jgi:hypothetical protein